ncbi:MAG: NADPH:quinone reductase [Woeseia sp.]
MKASWYEGFGPAADVLVVGEQPAPEPQAGEVLVRLMTSGINPSDVKKRAGAFPELLDDGLVIPHSDGAGVIAAVGEGVSDREIGERVWVYQAQYGRRFGTAAEFVAVDSCRVPPLPENTSFEVGACLGIPAMTAHRCVFADGPVDGQTLLVTGGAGRVGHYAIQWASQAAARVVATASCPEDEQACVEAGAMAVVNHRRPGWCNEVLHLNEQSKVDRVIDVQFGANLGEVLNLIRIGGTIATYSSTEVPEPRLPFLKMMFMDLTVRFVNVYAMPEVAKQDAISDIDKRLQAGQLRHRVTHVLPLDDVAQAHEIIERGNCRGCVVIKPEGR